jgi:uncharacterized protein (DUF427 family)
MSNTEAHWNGHVIASSDACITVEGTAYFPAHALDKAFFQPSTHQTVCGWKGTANYFDVIVDGKTNANAAWVYRDPKAAASPIAGYVAFWKGVEVTGGEFAKPMAA